MADMILSYQQDSVRNDINLFLQLVRSGAPRETLDEIWKGILLLVEDEAERYPPELVPSNYWKGRTVFSHRATRPMIRLYLHQLYRYLDTLAQKNLPR